MQKSSMKLFIVILCLLFAVPTFLHAKPDKVDVKMFLQGASHKKSKTINILAPISQIRKNWVKMKCELLP